MKRIICKLTGHFLGLMTGHFERDWEGSYFICNFCKEKDYFTQRIYHLVSNMKQKDIENLMHNPEEFKQEAKEVARAVDLFALKYGTIGFEYILKIMKVGVAPSK